MAGTAYLTRMPLGIAGGVTRPRDLTIEPVTFRCGDRQADLQQYADPLAGSDD